MCVCVRACARVCARACMCVRVRGGGGGGGAMVEGLSLFAHCNVFHDGVVSFPLLEAKMPPYVGFAPFISQHSKFVFFTRRHLCVCVCVCV